MKPTTEKAPKPPEKAKSKGSEPSSEGDEPSPPDQDKGYVGPTALPKTATPKSEPEAKVVLNLPDVGAKKADEEQVKMARARRRSATVRVARTDIPELVSLQKGGGPASPPDSSPGQDGSGDDEIEVDLDEPGRISKPSSLRPPPGGPASVRPSASKRPSKRPSKPPISKPPPSAVLSYRPPARGARGRKVTLAVLVAIAMAGAVALFMVLDPKFNPETQRTVESAVESPAAAQTADAPPEPTPTATAEPTATVTDAPTASASAPPAATTAAAPPPRPISTWKPPPRPVPRRPPPPTDIPQGI